MKFIPAFLCCFVAFSVSAQRNIFDSFDDNSNSWPVGGGGHSSMNVMNGYYEVTSEDEGFWYHTYTVKDGMSDHFRLEVSVSRDEKTAAGKGAGLVWGVKGDSVRMAFLLYGDGNFVFQKYRNGKSQSITNKGITFNIFQDGYNNMRVERNMETGMYDFSLNEQLVLSSPYESPLSDDVGIYCDIAGTFHFDNFWFVEKGNAADSYRPGILTLSEQCGGGGEMQYTSDFGFAFCLPMGWRVDNYKESHWLVWPVGDPYQVNLDFAKLAIEDSFSVAARNDFKIFVDSAKEFTDKKISPLQKETSAEGVEVFGGAMVYTDAKDNNRYVVYRYYVYHQKTGAFLLIETTTPFGYKNAEPSLQAVAGMIAHSIRWE